MKPPRNALGRGISALIPTADKARDFFECPLERISPMERQPRQHFDQEALNELSASIKESGLLQPLVVRRDGARYVLIAGERRWRAAKAVGLSAVPVIVRETSDEEAFALALVENLQRKDLSPLEMAEACQRLLSEHGLTQEEVAKRIGKSRSAVANTLRLLKLGRLTREALAGERITEGHARQFVGIAAKDEEALLQRVIQEGLSVRATEAAAKALKATPAPPPMVETPAVAPEPALAGPLPDSRMPAGLAPQSDGVQGGPGAVAALLEPFVANGAAPPALERVLQGRFEERQGLLQIEETLTRALGVPVKIQLNQDGQGRMELGLSSYEVLEALTKRLLS